MKFLLCSSVFENEKDLIEHYISYHNVDQTTDFFRSYSNKVEIVQYFKVFEMR